MSKKLILSIVIIIVILGLGYWVYRTILTPEKSTEGEQSIKLKTFTNTEYKFEIKYPKSWYNVKAPNAAFFSTIPAATRDSLPEGYYYGKQGGYGLLVIDYIKPEYVEKEKTEQNTNDALDAYLLSFQKSAQTMENGTGLGKWRDATSSRITVDGMAGVEISWISEEYYKDIGTIDKRYITDYVLDKSRNGMFEIKGEFLSKDIETYISNFRQILSTFKFLE